VCASLKVTELNKTAFKMLIKKILEEKSLLSPKSADLDAAFSLADKVGHHRSSLMPPWFLPSPPLLLFIRHL
jgi:hypothetical protein